MRPLVAYRSWCLLFIGCFGLVAVGSRRFFLFGDDYAFLGQGREDMSVGYLRLDLFGHFSPVSRLVDWLMVHVFLGSPGALGAVLLVIVGLTQLSVIHLFRVAVRSRPVALVGAGLCCTSVTLVSLANWWTAGLNILPGVAGSALAMAGAITALTTGSRRGMVLSLAGYLLGGLSWELAVLMPAYVLAYALLIAWPGSEASLGRQLRRTWPLWVGLAAAGLTFGVNYLAFYSVPSPGAPLVDYALGMGVSLVGTVLPSLLGLFSTDYGGVLTAARFAIAALLGVAVWVTVRRDSAAWRGWLFAALGWLLPSGALVVSRVGVHGPWVATLPFYFLLPVIMSVLGLAIVASPFVERRDLMRPTPRRSGVIVAALVVGYLAVWVPSADAAARVITTFSATIQRVVPPSGSFVDNLRASLEDVEREQGTGVTVVNADVPAGLVAAAYAPYNRLDWVAEVNGVPAAFDVLGRPPYVAGDDGRLGPAHLTPRFMRAFGAKDSGLVQNGLPASYDDREGLCFTVTSPLSGLRLEVPPGVDGSGLLLTTRLTVNSPSTRRILAARYPAGPQDVVNYDTKRWEPGAGGGIDSIRQPAVRVLSYDSFTVGTRVCFQGVGISQLT